MRCVARLIVAALFLSVFASAQQMDRLDRERMIGMLNVVSKDVEKNFYDPSLKGLNWRELTAEARTKIEAAKMPSEAITAISLLVDKLDDSHTKFLPPSRVNRPFFGFEAKMFGDEARIYSTKPGGAAEKAGLRMGDRIVQIFNYRPTRKDFDQAMLYYRLLHPMSELKITYQRGEAPPQTVTVTAKVKQGTMSLDFSKVENIYQYLVENFSDDEKYFWGMLEGDIGYIEVPSFSAEEVVPIRALGKSKATIVDLRGDPGGRIDSVAEFAGHFESKPAVLANMIGRKKTEPVKIKPHGPNFDVPMFILLDSRSASAAEMFARYFQKTGQAKVVGDVSSGRVYASRYYSEGIGSSSVIPFGVQISVSRVAFADGEELEHHPVVPDYPCLPSEADLRVERDPCLKKAVALARKAAGRTEELPEKLADQVEHITASINEFHAQERKRPD